MCKFFSLLSDENNIIYYFDAKQRMSIKNNKLLDKSGNPIKQADSHSSIAAYYFSNGAEDNFHKWEYDVFLDALTLDRDCKQFPVDKYAVLSAVRQINYSDIAGDVEAVRNLLFEIKTMNFGDNHGAIDPNWRVFDNRDAAGAAAGAAAGDAAWDAAGAAARDAAGDAAWDAARGAASDAAGAAARDAARDAAWDAARGAASDAAWGAARCAASDAAWGAASDAAWGAALLSRCLVVNDKIDIKHLSHAKSRWEVYKLGYWLLCDVNGVFYVYKKP